jgi:hypothetical protein
MIATYGNFFGPDMLIILLIIPMSLGFVTWMIVDCIQKESPEGNDKLIWMLVILLAPLGSLIYFFARKLTRPARPSSPPPLP